MFRKLIFGKAALIVIVMLTVTAGVIAALVPEGAIERGIYHARMSFITADSVVADSNEYAPGISAVDQIQTAPSPRYRPGHKLMPNVLWMSPRYFGGTGQPGIPLKEIIGNSTAIMLSLAQRMNYYLVLPGNTYGLKGYNDTNTIAGAYIHLANKHPELPASVITFWGQINPKSCGYKHAQPAIFRSDFPPAYYIDAGKRKRLSPAAPDDSLIMDGKVLRCYLENLCSNLKRPVQLVNENGEVFKLFGRSLLEKNELCLKDKEKRKIEDWDVYEATRRLEKEKLVQKQFLDLPCLKDAIYTQYGIDGHRTYRHHYEETRKIGDEINGQYYPTPDFYPRWPSNWKMWKGAWHGFKWIADCRNVEIKNGDILYSPFVSPGWDINETKNIRPAQWLGLLKVLGVTGAEFYYTGYFNLKKPFAKPENYAWQALIPAYAQAITSRYEEVLRKGELLNPPLYNFSKKPDELIVVRRLADKKVYVISGTIQPSSNNKGSSPLERSTSITLDGKNISFMIRRQGSTYIYDLSGSTPLFYQLDSWHRYEHPSRWNTGVFNIEAEVYDNDEEEPVRKTESLSSTDFTAFTTYIRLDKSMKASYQAELNITPQKVYVWLKARGQGKVKVNNGEDSSVNSEKWTWIKAATLDGFQKGIITLEGRNTDVDQIQINHTANHPVE